MNKRIADNDGKINGFLEVVFHNNSSSVSCSMCLHAHYVRIVIC